MKVSEYSRQYVKVPVRVKDATTGAWRNPTTLPGAMWFDSMTDIGGGPDWRPASWETDVTTHPDTYYLRCLVGPGGDAPLTADTYKVLVRITDNPEVPVMDAGMLVVE